MAVEGRNLRNSPGHISYAEKRSHVKLDEAVQLLSDEKQSKLDNTIENKKKKRRVEAEECPLEETPVGTGSDGDCFLKPVSEDVRQQRISKFIDVTGNTAMKTLICAICARRFSQKDICEIGLSDLQQNQNLIPSKSHPAHRLTNGVLLHENPLCFHENDTGISFADVCLSCASHLRRKKTPPLSLTNGMLNTEDITKMADGQIMPPSPSILTATIGVTFVGPKNLLEKTMPGFLLNTLPTNGIPSEIFSLVRYLPDTTILAQEMDGYVPEEPSDDEPVPDVERSEDEWEMSSGRKTSHTEVCIISEVAESIPLQSLGVVDVTATNVQENEILANTLSNVARSDIVNGWAVKRGKKQKMGLFLLGHLRTPITCLAVFPACSRMEKAGSKKRQLCAAAALQISKRSFLCNERAIRNLKPSDFHTAAAEEQAHKPFSNPVIQSLHQNLSTVRAKVMGTDESRIKVYTQDPIAQVLCGHNIDLDSFDAFDHNTSGGEIAVDPYAATSFFHLMVNMILEVLLSITIGKGNGPIKRETGILGDVDACIGTVEAQVAEDWIDKNGNWGPKRSHGYFNNWNLAVLQCLHANHDIKLITNGVETKDITWYITHYVEKKQNSSSNISALLAKTLAFHRTKERLTNDLKTINKWLIQRCGNALSHKQELSAPEVISYLMGWGDRFISHCFKTIHWHSVVQLLKQTYPVLNTRPQHLSHSMHADSDVPGATSNCEQDDDTVNIQMVEGRLYLKDQICEYMDRREALLTWNFLDYFLGMYDGKFLKEKTSAGSSNRVDLASEADVESGTQQMRTGVVPVCTGYTTYTLTEGDAGNSKSQ
ncbi:hypothetical protein EDB84DRAFT_1632649 [Lactarius hengduanensis]|nr:hypothetical protein EDB84DRAFT_1632649 [Lactarius hengduanensis]